MSPLLFSQLSTAFLETLAMVGIAGALSVLLGLPLGILLLITRKNGLLEHIAFHTMISSIVNAIRSIPFIILLIAIVPLTRLIVGTSIGTSAAIVPLTIGAIPFVARIADNVLAEVPKGLIEAGIVMGATPLQIIYKILLPEALPGLINGVTVTLVTLVSYSAMAGAVGGGGLGDLAIRYGYQRFEVGVMITTVILLIALVQLIQSMGDSLSKHFSH